MRRFIIEYAETDREFRNMLHAHFAGKSGEDGKRIYTEMINNAGRIAADKSGFIDYYNANKAIQPVDVLIEKAHAAFARKHYTVAADISFAVIEGVRGRLADVLSIFGKVPFFYYLLHIPLIHVSAIVVNEIIGIREYTLAYNSAPYVFMPDNQHWSLGLLYLVFIIDVVILYFLCRWYVKYKFAHPEQKWLKYL